MLRRKRKRTISKTIDQTPLTTDDVRAMIRDCQKIADKASKHQNNSDKTSHKFQHDIKWRLQQMAGDLIGKKLNRAHGEYKTAKRKDIETCRHTILDVSRRLQTSQLDSSTDNLDPTTVAHTTEEMEEMMNTLRVAIHTLQATEDDKISPLHVYLCVQIDAYGNVNMIDQTGPNSSLLPMPVTIDHAVCDNAETVIDLTNTIRDKTHVCNGRQSASRVLDTLFDRQRVNKHTCNVPMKHNSLTDITRIPYLNILELSQSDSDNTSRVTLSDSDNMFGESDHRPEWEKAKQPLDAGEPQAGENTDTESYGSCHYTSEMETNRNESSSSLVSMNSWERNILMCKSLDQSIFKPIFGTENTTTCISNKRNGNCVPRPTHSVDKESLSCSTWTVSPPSTPSDISSVRTYSNKSLETSDTSGYCVLSPGNRADGSQVSSAGSGYRIVNVIPPCHTDALDKSTTPIELEYISTCKANLHRSDCVIPDITVLESNRIVLTDHYHNNIQMFGEDFTFLTQEHCPYPMGVCHIGNDRFAVSLRRNRQIRLYDVTNDKLVHAKTITIKCEFYVWNVIHRTGCLYVMCDDNNIHVIDVNGVQRDIIHTHVPPNTGYIRYFDANSNGSRFYLCTMDGLVCINQHGDRIWAGMGDSKSFPYLPEDVCWVRGRLLATHWMGGKIFEISADGKFIRDVITDHLQHPRAMSLSPGKTFMVVSQFHPQMSVHDSKNRELKLFKLV